MRRHTTIGVAVISRAREAQTTIAGCACPRQNPAPIAPPNTAMKKRWIRKVPKSVSGLAESPLGVTTNRLLRRSTASSSDRAYTGADSADITMPATPPDPSGSCGETLCRRFHTYSPICSADALPYSISQTTGSMSTPEAPRPMKSAQLSAARIQFSAEIG